MSEIFLGWDVCSWICDRNLESCDAVWCQISNKQHSDGNEAKVGAISAAHFGRATMPGSRLVPNLEQARHLGSAFGGDRHARLVSLHSVMARRATAQR